MINHTPSITHKLLFLLHCVNALAMDAPRFPSLLPSLLATALCLLQCLLPQLISAQNDAGFISLDCGLTTKPYNDSSGIQWVSDKSIPNLSGFSANINQSGLTSTLRTLRYFPGNLSKYCYELKPVTVGSWYLVRAMFWYGNYDGKNQTTVSFDLLLDADMWNTVVVKSGIESVNEVYVQAQRDSINVCLARNGLGDPFISSLVLRPLRNDMTFTTLRTGYYTLYMKHRINYGTLSPAFVRYPDDMFDRIWFTDTSTPFLPESTQPVITPTVDFPPSKVLMTARGAQGIESLEFTFSDLAGNNSYFIALYFAEINGSVGAEGKRVFTVTYNGGILFYGPLDIYKTAGDRSYAAVEVRTTRELVIQDYLNFTLTPVEGSVLGPLLCALEILSLSQNPLNESTYESDVQALADVKANLNLNGSTGDPCRPIGYKYDWLTCSSTSPPRIVSINLTSRYLVGTISPSINSLSELTQISLAENNLTGPIPELTSLTKLQSLNLQNNSLSGEIPMSLATLPSLSELLLQNNNLSGTIPQSLQQKALSPNFIFKGNDAGASQMLKYDDFTKIICQFDDEEFYLWVRNFERVIFVDQ